MLLGMINNGREQIYIKLKSINNFNYIYFDKVSDKGVLRLNSFECKNIIHELFNTEKKFIENIDGYDLYIDSNNYKRFYKDGIEDFYKFYLSNGIIEISYDGKGKKKPFAKIFLFLVGGVATTVMISSLGIELLGRNIDNNNIRYSMNIDSSYQDLITLENIQDYFFSSDGLTSYEKVDLYNEDYLKFLLCGVDNNRKCYDLHEKFKGINIVPFEQDEMENASGYYSNDNPNTIHILNTVEDENTRMEIARHEFIHLTQTISPYFYLKEALAVIMNNEFYGTPINSYNDPVKRVKILMELIGPLPVFKAAYSTDQSELRTSLLKYLSEDECNKLLELFSSPDIFDSEKNSKLNTNIDVYLNEIFENKWSISDDIDGKELEKEMITILRRGDNDKRLYFNSNKHEFYDDYKVCNSFLKGLPIETNSFADVEKIVKGYGMIPSSVMISSVEYKKTDFVSMLSDSDFIKFVNDFDVVILEDESSNYRFRKNEDGLYIYENDLKERKYSLSDLINSGFDCIELVSNSNDYSWNDFNNNCYLDSCLSNNSVFKYGDVDDNEVVNLTYNVGGPLVIPSIYEKYGCIYPQNINSDNIEHRRF